MTAQANADAVVAAINAQFATPRAYELDAVPSPRPANYIEVSVSRRFGGEFRQCGDVGTTGYRVTVRAVSQTKVKNVREALEGCRLALEDALLPVADDTTTPIQFETEDPAAYDNGWFSGLHSYTYAI